MVRMNRTRLFIVLFSALVIGGCASAGRSVASQGEEVVSLCILRDGAIATVSATYRPETGDTVVDGRPWKEVYPTISPPYAERVSWYLANEPIPIPGRRYSLAKYGITRILAPNELKRYGEYRGLPLFVEAEDNSRIADVVYLFVRPGCVFHPYQQTFTPGPVRGR